MSTPNQQSAAGLISNHRLHAKRRGSASRRLASAVLETLESRTLMSVSIAATKSQAFDINPNSSGQGVFTFSRTDSTAQPLQVNFSVSSDSTASTSRYQPLGASVTIPAGKRSVTLGVHPLFDAVPLPTQTVVLSIDAFGAYSINSKRASATVKITDKAPTVSLVVTRPHASEVDPGGRGLGQFAVKRSGFLNEPLTINYNLDPSSTALNELDFTALSGSVTIPKGKPSALINVTPIADHQLEPMRILSVNLGTGSYFASAKNSASLTIADDGTSQTPRGAIVSIAAGANASEASATSGNFVVSRTGSTSSDLTVNYTVAGTAVAGTDFTALSGSVLIPAGQSSANITVIPANPSATGDQTVIVSLTGFSSENAALTSATLTIAAGSGGVSETPGWFNTQWHDRVPVSVNVGSTTRTDKPVDYSINFSQALSALGKSGTLNENSIRVVEVSADGSTVVHANVPFQFDKAANYDANNNAAGNLVFLMTGTTQANTTRHYDVYFDTGSGFTAANVTPLVMTTDNTNDAGQTTVTIATPTATYFLQKDNGGFSSIVDKNGNDWLSFDPTVGSGSGGEFRGLPNAVFNGGFHAGFNYGSTQIVSTGPLKTTLLTTITVNTGAAAGPATYVMKYEIYPTYVTATMERADDSYWFLYEGTPGGTLPDNTINTNDYIVQSDGTQSNIQNTFTNNGIGSSNGQEWLYFESVTANRYLFMVKDQATSQPDDYFDMNGQMTVFGFGRDNSQTNQAAHRLTGVNSFTFGLADGGTDFNASATQINGTYQPLTLLATNAQTLL